MKVYMIHNLMCRAAVVLQDVVVGRAGGGRDAFCDVQDLGEGGVRDVG